MLPIRDINIVVVDNPAFLQHSKIANLVILVNMVTRETVDEPGGALDDPRTEGLEDRGWEIRQELPDPFNRSIRLWISDNLRTVDRERREAQITQFFWLLQWRHFVTYDFIPLLNMCQLNENKQIIKLDRVQKFFVCCLKRERQSSASSFFLFSTQVDNIS